MGADHHSHDSGQRWHHGVVDDDPALDRPAEHDQAPAAEPGEVLRAGGLIDGATTLGEAAARLRREAERLAALDAAGWTLVGPVEEGLGQLVDPDGNAGGDGA